MMTIERIAELKNLLRSVNRPEKERHFDSYAVDLAEFCDLFDADVTMDFCAALMDEIERLRELLSLLNGRRMAGEVTTDWIKNDGTKSELCRRVEAALAAKPEGSP